MRALTATDDIFFNQAGLDRPRTESLVEEALRGADDGELFLEWAQSEALVWDDGRLKSATFDTDQGFGLRAVAGEAAGYGHASALDEATLRRAVPTLRGVVAGHAGTFDLAPPPTNRILYDDGNPIAAVPFEQKVALLAEIDAYLRAKDPAVRQVSVSLAAEWQAVRIVRPGGRHAADLRPLVRLSVSVVAARGDRLESGSHGGGGRAGYEIVMAPAAWKATADEALRQALVKLDAVDAPAGEFPVVLGPGWPGILLHEAVGHGLEGDFNRKGSSAFAGLMGRRVAAPGVTVVDDGTIEGRRGSLTIDDEGTPTSRTVLIEDGILVGFMQDRMNGRLMGGESTGNGRRQSHAHHPMPRMTNTVMLAGPHDPADVLASVDRGIYAVSFGGGQVDITNGKFVFSASEAYLIENGRIGAPVRGATLIGNGADALTRVSMIGNDLALDPGIGVCGKEGQGVPVGVGQPTLRIDGLTVGGTRAG